MPFFPTVCFLGLFCSGVEPGRTAQEPTAIGMRDLESQIVEQQAAAPRSFWSRIFSCFYPRARSRPANDHQWSDYSRTNIEISQNFIANETDSAATNNDGKAASHRSPSLRSDQSGTLIVDETDSTAITEVDGNVAFNETISTASTASLSDNVTGESAQHIIIPPPNVHATNSLNAAEFQKFAPVKSPALASPRRCFHENSRRDADQRQNASGEHSVLWEIFQGPAPPKSLSAKERLRARYTRPTEFPEVESAWLAVPISHGLDQDVKAPFIPAREGWARYHRYT